MATIDQIYRDNLRILIKEAGSQAALCDTTGKSAAQISQWLNASRDSKTNKPRSMSRATARELEQKCGKPEGWMDQPHALVTTNYDAFLDEALGLSPSEKRFVEDMRVIADDEDVANEIRHLVATKAAKMRTMRQRWLQEEAKKARPLDHPDMQVREADKARAGKIIKPLDAPPQPAQHKPVTKRLRRTP